MYKDTHPIQALLNQEAGYANEGNHAEREKVHVMIKLMRTGRPPVCWGNDDCSTSMLSVCPWRIDCGSKQSIDWQDNLTGI